MKEQSLNQLFSLENQVIVVTGGAGLLGFHHAEAIVAYGGVPILWDIDTARIESVVQELKKKTGANICADVVDITCEEAVERATAKILRDYGVIDGLVNNAANNPKQEESGIDQSSRLENFSVSRWSADLAVGLTGAFICAKILSPEIAKNDCGGSIVNVSSDLGLIAPDQTLYETPGLSWDQQPVKPISYSVVKAGLIGLTKYLATYWPDGRVRCNALCPGGVANDQDELFLERVQKLIPLGRLASPAEYQGAIIFLLSKASSYCNGGVFSVDGGRTAK